MGPCSLATHGTSAIYRLSRQLWLSSRSRPRSNDPPSSTDKNMNTYTAGCIFAGMGGLASGFENSGFKILWANDSNASACATFRHRFQSVRVIQKSIEQLSVRLDQLDTVDVLIGGFPCQSFSQAGSRKGFGDPRGRLFFQIPRLLSEFSIKRIPRLVVLENVPHLLYGSRGSWFAQVQHTLRQAGYWFRRESCWVVNVHKETSLPQDRHRLFMVAASRRHFRYNPFSPPHSHFSTHRMTIDDVVDRTTQGHTSLYLKPHTKYHSMIMDAMNNGTSRKNVYQIRRSYVREKKNRLCPTLTANMGLGGHNVPFIEDQWGIRRLSVQEVAQLQGFSTFINLFPSLSSPERYRLLGNAVCVRLATRLASRCRQILEGHQ